MKECTMLQRLQNLRNEVDVEMDTAIDNLIESKKYILQQVDYLINDIHNAIEDSTKAGIIKAAEGD